MLNIQHKTLLDGFNSKQKNDLYFLGTFSSNVEAIDQNNRPKLDLSLVIDFKRYIFSNNSIKFEFEKVTSIDGCEISN